MKKISALILTFVIAMSLAIPAFAADFKDVPQDFWAYGQIQAAVQNGVTNGYADGCFRPDNPVTNAHFAAYLARAFYAGEYTEGGAAPWYNVYTETLNRHGVLDGATVSGSFADSINRPIDRYDMARMMYNILADKGVELPEQATLDQAQSRIGDWESIPADCRTAVSACYELGILRGQADGCFGGQNLMNRAQACVVVSRLAQVISGAGGSL